MDEYIKRQAALDALQAPEIFNINPRHIELIKNIPAADVAPVGWISVKDKLPEPEPQLDIEAVTTGETKAEREAFDFLRRRFNRKE